MLLRSSSTPMLKSWVPQSSEPELSMQISPISSRSNSIPPSFSFDHNRIKKISINLTKANADVTSGETSPTKCSCMQHGLFLSVEDGEEDAKNLSCKIGEGESRRAVEMLVGGGGGGGGPGGGGGGRGGGDGEEGWCWDANHSSMDVYYKSMIKANPGNYMILTNYATFLKEIRGDLVKAEEYFGRAILANPKSGNVLSLYADLIWQVYQDAKRAHIYFDRAVKADPENSYVVASYARFLWDAEDEIEGQQ